MLSDHLPASRRDAWAAQLRTDMIPRVRRDHPGMPPGEFDNLIDRMVKARLAELSGGLDTQLLKSVPPADRG